MPILGHAAICISVPLEGSSGLSIQKPQVKSACQVAINALDGIPVCRAGVRSEMGDSGDCEHDVRSCGKGCPVEGADSLVVQHIMHNCVLCCACRCLLDCEPGGGVHGH